MHNTQLDKLRFQRLGIVSVVVVYLLILAGGIVRSTGSGMGCPDWPKCFGRIIPPTKESELPANYQEIYKNHGYGTTKFNVVKTWIEYVNRLLGAITGILVIIFFSYSFCYRKTDSLVVKLSGLVLLLVIIEGIIGKYVVQLNLKGESVTLHFWGSIIIILLLIYIVARTRKSEIIVTGLQNSSKLNIVLIFIIVLTVIQVILGTQVRQEVETLSIHLDYTNRNTWIDQLSSVFYIHRSFSILIVLAHFYFLYIQRKFNTFNNILNTMTVLLVGVLIIEVLAGIIMNYFDFPAFVQPIHMLFGSVLMGLQFFILVIINFSVSSNHYKQVSV